MQCKLCGKELNHTQSVYCSRQCSAKSRLHTPEIIARRNQAIRISINKNPKRLEYLRTLCGKNSAEKRKIWPEIKCKFCGKILDQRIKRQKTYCSRACRNKDNPHNQIYKRKGQILTCSICQKQFYIPKNQFKRYSVHFCSRKCKAKAQYVILQKFLPSLRNTKIELLLQDELRKRGIQFKTHQKIGNYFPDILIPEQKIIIQADGKYWHSRPEAIMNDKKQNKFFEREGYKVFHFTEDEINKSPSSCIAKLPPINIDSTQSVE